MTERHTVDSITSDALDQLYDRLARAEAAIARVRAVAGWAIQGWSDLSPEKVLLAVEGEQPAPAPAATQATDVKTLPPVPVSDGIAEMYGGWPREHCGRLSPDTGLTTVRTECTLRPGHQGSHADDRGARWWYDPT